METLIHRARTALALGVPAEDIIDALVKTGSSGEEAYLAVCAAEILLTPWVSAERMTLPEIPASKIPPRK